MKKGFIEPGAKPKRFYKDVTVVAEEGGFAVKLDGRNVRSPKGGKLNVPTQALADMVAAEWAGQGEVIARSRPFSSHGAPCLSGRSSARHRARGPKLSP